MSRGKTVSVIGLGYIGLPTAAILAEAGFQVTGVDVRPDVVSTINSGDIHIHEPGLGTVVRAAVQCGRLRASTTPEPADVHVVAVPTPIRPDKSPDMTYVDAAVESVAAVLRRGDLVILESTVPPRTCIGRVAPMLRELTGLSVTEDYFLAHCPERVIPGRILHEIMHNDRVIGGVTPEATGRATDVYASFVRGDIVSTDATTAEMCKLMENTFRDVNIALANEFAEICDTLDLDVFEAIAMANRHPRVSIHTPGIGVGGHCIPVDPYFIAHSAPDASRMISLARRINEERPGNHVRQILAGLDSEVTEVAFLGLSYKPDVDDIRESPAVELVRTFAEADPLRRAVQVVEPHIRSLPAELAAFPNVRLAKLDESLRTAGAIVSLVPHSQFRDARLSEHDMRKVVDLARVWPSGTATPSRSATAATERDRDDSVHESDTFVETQ